MQNLTAPALAEWLADQSRPAPVLLDVREPWEIQTASIAGAVSDPHARNSGAQRRVRRRRADRLRLPSRCAQRAGCDVPRSRGHTNVFNLQGRIDAWSRQVDPSVQTY